MFIQAAGSTGTNPSEVLTAFVTTMVGLSVATERVTQMIKQWIAKWITASPAAIHVF